MESKITHTETCSGSWIPQVPERRSGCCSSLSLYLPLGTGELSHSYPERQQRHIIYVYD